MQQLPLTRQPDHRRAANEIVPAGMETRTAGVSFRPRIYDREGAATMSILAWLVLGLIAGFIASKIVNHSGAGALLDIALGIVGAMVGGWLFNQFGGMGVTGFNLYSMVVATIGAIVILVIYHAIFGRRVTY
jgi:uncharacterized membrane protein YeaQ/YmgE (transglycosylase-associated protein family)